MKKRESEEEGEEGEGGEGEGGRTRERMKEVRAEMKNTQLCVE